LGWLVPKPIHLHPLHIVDIKSFGLGRALSSLGFTQLVFAGTITAQRVSDLFGKGMGLTCIHLFWINGLPLIGTNISN